MEIGLVYKINFLLISGSLGSLWTENCKKRPLALTSSFTPIRAWNTTMDKQINEREHNDCQQLITKSHGRSWLDSNIQPQEESNAYLSVKGRVTVNITCQCSENSYFWRVIDHKYQAPCWVFLISTHIPQHVTLSCVLCVEMETTFFHCACSINHTFLTQ